MEEQFFSSFIYVVERIHAERITHFSKFFLGSLSSNEGAEKYDLGGGFFF